MRKGIKIFLEKLKNVVFYCHFVSKNMMDRFSYLVFRETPNEALRATSLIDFEENVVDFSGFWVVFIEN